MGVIAQGNVALTVESPEGVTKQLDNVREAANQGGEEFCVTQVNFLSFCFNANIRKILHPYTTTHYLIMTVSRYQSVVNACKLVNSKEHANFLAVYLKSCIMGDYNLKQFAPNFAFLKFDGGRGETSARHSIHKLHS